MQHNDRFQRVPVWFFFFTAFLTELTSLIEMAVLRHIDRVRNLSRDRIQTLIVIGLTDDRF